MSKTKIDIKENVYAAIFCTMKVNEDRFVKLEKRGVAPLNYYKIIHMTNALLYKSFEQ